MSLLARGGECRMAPGIQGSLLRQTSSYLGCSEASLVCPSDVGFGKSGSVWDLCSKLRRPGCSALGCSKRNELGDWVRDSSAGLGGHAPGSDHCSERHQRDYVDDQKLAGWEIHRFDDDQSRQMNALDACDVHVEERVPRPERFVAIAFGWNVEEWMEILRCLSRKSHHHLIQRNGLLADENVADA